MRVMQKPCGFSALIRHTDARNQLLSAPHASLVRDVPNSLLTALDDCADLVRMPGALQRHRLRWRLADCFAQIFEASEQRQQVNGLSQSQRRSMQHWLAEHIAHDPQAADLAQLTGLSPATFRRRCQATFGCSPRQWISNERLRLVGEQLLENNEQFTKWPQPAALSAPSFTRLFTPPLWLYPIAVARNRPIIWRNGANNYSITNIDCWVRSSIRR